MMLKYYFELALRSFRRSPGLTALMLLTIAIGVGACMTTLTVFHVLSGDPIPGKSDRLFNIQLDAQPMRGYKPGDEPPLQLTRLDAETLLREARADRQVMMTAGMVAVEVDDQKPAFVPARYSSADFFAMFEVPIRLGRSWTAADDKAAARVAVISDRLNEQLFGGGNPVGKVVRVRDKDLSIIGVMGKWRPVPTFYDMTIGAYRNPEDVYLPFTTAMDLKFGSMGNFNCWAEHAPSTSRDSGAPCAWIQYWAEAGSLGRAGGLLGLLLTGLGLWAVRSGSADYAGMIELDTVMLITTLALALLASLAAGLLPAWRATQVTPALQLKTQ